MAKGSRSNRQKVLRTVRRQHTSQWQEEADRRRLETLHSCASTAPVPAETSTAPEQPEPMRTSKPAAEASAPMDTDAPKPSKKRKGKVLAAKGGVGKKRQKQIGVLDKWALEHPEKRKRNRGKKRS